MINKLLRKLVDKVTRRPPDQVIGGTRRPYLLRWCLIPKNRFFNVYIHVFFRSDDDRALHDHPWFWFSYLIQGSYAERTKKKCKVKREGSFRVRSPWTAHRIILMGDVEGKLIPVTTLFITGPRIRKWGFHCEEGWVHEDEYFKQGGCQ